MVIGAVGTARRTRDAKFPRKIRRRAVSVKFRFLTSSLLMAYRKKSRRWTPTTINRTCWRRRSYRTRWAWRRRRRTRKPRATTTVPNQNRGYRRPVPGIPAPHRYGPCRPPRPCSTCSISATLWAPPPRPPPPPCRPRRSPGRPTSRRTVKRPTILKTASRRRQRPRRWKIYPALP